jgi:hypothetical protein
MGEDCYPHVSMRRTAGYILLGRRKKLINWRELLITQVAVCKIIRKKLGRTLAG